MVQKNQKKHKLMKSSTIRPLQGPRYRSRTLTGSSSQEESFMFSKNLKSPQSLPNEKTHDSTIDWAGRGKASSLQSFPKFSVKMEKPAKRQKNESILKEFSSVESVKKSMPCLFVKSLKKGNEVLGTPLMNRFVRFLTKKGKKSKAHLLFAKTCTLLAHFEAEKNTSKEMSSGLDRQDRLDKFQGDSSNSPKSFDSKFAVFSSHIIVEQAVSHVKPFLEVKKVRVAGTTYQVPAILEKHRQENFALKWILQSASERHKKNPSQPLEYSLAFEIYEASQKQGQARMKRNELHKLAEANRAFAHFRWW